MDDYKEIEYTTNVSEATAQQTAEMSSYGIPQSQTIQIGAGSTAFKVDDSGLWLGGNKYADAPFKVDMNGNVIANSIDLSGAYVATGGSASDINNNSTTVSGGKITAGSITADKLSVTSLSAISADLGTVTAGTINASLVTISNLNATNITTGTINGIAISGSTISGASTWNGNAIAEAYIGNLSASKITSGTISADRIGAGSITASKLSVSTLSSITADIGTVTAGTIDGLTINLPRSSTGGGSGTTGYLKWGGQSKIWSDTNNDMGINAIGGDLYIYTDNSQRIYVGTSNINLYTATTYIKKINFGFDGQNEGNIENVNIIKGYNDVNFQLGDNGYYFSFYNTSYDEKARIESSGKFYSDSSTINLNGTDKSAIVKIGKEYRALYCAEAPEVWFFDFCNSKKEIDPLFIKATEGKYKFIKTEDGGYQVWRRRKGHAKKRFGVKTKEEFVKNERFLMTPKV